MRYAPTLETANPIPAYQLPHTPGHLIEVWSEALEAAAEFWERAAVTEGLSDELRQAAEQNSRVLRGAPRQGPGPI
jgi:hypothetical protein